MRCTMGLAALAITSPPLTMPPAPDMPLATSPTTRSVAFCGSGSPSFVSAFLNASEERRPTASPTMFGMVTSGKP
jgi:hypothetical protein